MPLEFMGLNAEIICKALPGCLREVALRGPQKPEGLRCPKSYWSYLRLQIPDLCTMWVVQSGMEASGERIDAANFKNGVVSSFS